MTSHLPEPTGGDTLALAAIGAASLALCDAFHELAHAAMTLLPGHGAVLSIASVGIGTTTRDAAVAAAGPLMNLALGACLALSLHSRLAPNWRFCLWLFGTVNLFDATAYLLYSAALGSGDWATVFDAIGPASVWRPAAAIGGTASYAGAVCASSRVLGLLVDDGVVSRAQAVRGCPLLYWAGGAVLVAASALNPIGPMLILTSGIATGFGAMAGLLLVPALLKGGREAVPASAEPASFGQAWLVAGGFVSMAFVLVLGRGVQLTS